VAETLYTKALVKAAEIQGSTQALASLLRVPENTLLRWMAGRAQMPVQAFLRLVELIAKQERAEPAGPPEGQGAAAEKLRFTIGEHEARCARCDTADFVLAPGTPRLRYTAELVCCNCGERVIHGNLICQLAQDAVYHSRAMTYARVRHRRAPKTTAPRMAEPSDD
jgi:hypothetical protein